MPCPEPDRVLDYIGGRLGTDARDAFDAHVDECRDCRALIVEFARTEVGEGITLAKIEDPVELGRYKIERLLGEGGMGTVFAAYDPQLDRRVAIKLVHPDLAARGGVKWLVQEGRALARLAHPNVVRVYDAGVAGERVYIAMELIEGETFTTWLASTRRAWREILATAIDAARGVAAAHRAGIIHRDIKPDNVLIDRERQVKVADFGLAVADLAFVSDDTAASREPPTSLAATTRVVGTPAYMAPEQWLGGKVGAAADQFSFCVVLWEAFAGSRPYRVDGSELRSAVLRGPAQLDASVLPRRLRAAILRGLEPEPDRRWPSMDVLLRKLEWARRRIALPIALGLAAALAVVLVIWNVAHVPPTWQPHLRVLEPVFDENANAPAFSPDGRQLAFVSDRIDPRWGVLVMPVTGGPATPIETTLDGVDVARWTRDGKALLLLRTPRLVRHPLDGSPEVVIADDVEDVDDCGDSLVIVDDTQRLVLLAPDGTRRVLLNGDPLTRPRCDAGQRIVYVQLTSLADQSSHPIDGALGDIWMIDRHGTRTRVTDDGRSADPTFTPDGRSIVFSRRDGATVDLYEQTLSDGLVHRLTSDGGPNLGPTISPDGTTLIFDRDMTNSEIHVGRPDGTRVRVPTSRAQFAGLQATRDGARVVGMRFDIDGVHVVAIDVATGHQTDLGLGEDAFLAADDRHVYFLTNARPGTLYLRSLDGGAAVPVATFPGAIVRGIATADGVHVLVDMPDHRRCGWTVEDGRAVQEADDGLVIPAPSKPWRAVVGADGVELRAPGQAAHTLPCNTGLGAWIDDHRFACARDGFHVAAFDTRTGTYEPLFETPGLMDDLRIVVTPQGLRWVATISHGDVTRYAITNFGERPWRP